MLKVGLTRRKILRNGLSISGANIQGLLMTKSYSDMLVNTTQTKQAGCDLHLAIFEDNLVLKFEDKTSEFLDLLFVMMKNLLKYLLRKTLIGIGFEI